LRGWCVLEDAVDRWRVADCAIPGWALLLLNRSRSRECSRGSSRFVERGSPNRDAIPPTKCWSSCERATKAATCCQFCCHFVRESHSTGNKTGNKILLSRHLSFDDSSACAGASGPRCCRRHRAFFCGRRRSRPSSTQICALSSPRTNDLAPVHILAPPGSNRFLL